MKKNIHPDYQSIILNCHCGQSYRIRSTIKTPIPSLDVCAYCHPFLSGKQVVGGGQSQMHKFYQRYKNVKTSISVENS